MPVWLQFVIFFILKKYSYLKLQIDWLFLKIKPYMKYL